jgi:rubrerythrin
MNLAKHGQIDEKALLKVDPTLRLDWQSSIKKIAKLEKDKEALESVSVKDESAIQNKEREINNAKAEFNEQVSKTFKDSKPAEIAAEVSKLTVSVMNNEKIPEGVRDVFINRAADLDPIKIMATINKIVELPQKASFAESVLKIRMDRVPNADKLSEKQKFEAINSAFKQKLIKNPGLKEINFMNDFKSSLKGSSAEEVSGVKQTEKERIIEQATKNLKDMGEEVFAAGVDVAQPGKETSSGGVFKDALQNLREERKIEAEDKKTLHEDIKNKGLDADSFHQTED